jgi:hypothetical protein
MKLSTLYISLLENLNPTSKDNTVKPRRKRKVRIPAITRAILGFISELVESLFSKNLNNAPKNANVEPTAKK